jgi:hypothetical protein
MLNYSFGDFSCFEFFAGFGALALLAAGEFEKFTLLALVMVEFARA